MATKRQNSRSRSSSKRQKKEYSKILVGSVLIGVAFFIAWCCKAMDAAEDFSALSTLITSVCTLGAIALMCYAYRCKQKDRLDMEMERLRVINEMKQKYGQDFIYEEMTDVNTDYPSL